jgi:hypothetical protein
MNPVALLILAFILFLILAVTALLSARRRAALWPVVLAAGVGFFVVLVVGALATARAAQAQPAPPDDQLAAPILNPLAAVPAYTGADPIDPDRLALATPDGRFAMRPVQGCDWLAPYQQVLTYPNWAVPPWLGLSGTDATTPGCVVRVEGRMDATPCFVGADGACALSAEYPEGTPQP